MKINILVGVTFSAIALFIACLKNNGPKTLPIIPEIADTFLPGEVLPEKTKPCFSGAYYRKMVSSKDYWLGIGGKVKLPTITFDPLRSNPSKPGQYLDNPSIYLGGNMGGQETDIGLTWEVVKDVGGNISADRRAFRPFFRRTSHPSGQTALYENAPAVNDYYWYPNDEVNISIQILTDKKVRFIVDGAGKRFEKDFDVDGYTLGGLGEFKRVNAIDQVNNEGKPVQPTKAKVENSPWVNTYLYRNVEGKLTKVNAHSGRLTDMRCPSSAYFSIIATTDDLKAGAEKISINGNGY